jgi:hypothetical protein
MIRRQAVTMRLPMARIAPVSRTCAFSQTDLEKKRLKLYDEWQQLRQAVFAY